MKPFDLSDLENKDPRSFWEERYADSLERQRGKAGQLLQQKIGGLQPGRALELGCSTGDDSLWLAEQGWQVTAIDISHHAIQTAKRLAKENKLAQKIQFIAMDLANNFPKGEFELVCALYFQSPFDFPRSQILQTAAARLVSGGYLLVVTHASSPPWAKKHNHDFEFPTLDSEWEDLSIDDQQWEIIDKSVKNRIAQGPEGEQAEVGDNLIFLRRR